MEHDGANNPEVWNLVRECETNGSTAASAEGDGDTVRRLNALLDMVQGPAQPFALVFGDGSNATRVAYFEGYIEGMTVRNFWFGELAGNKGADVTGYCDFEFGKYWTGSGAVSVFAAGPDGGIVLRRIQGMNLQLGTMNDPENVLVWRTPKRDSEGDHVGSSTAGASAHTYTNGDSVLECVYLVGGTITDVARDGQSLGAERVHYLAPGNAITISHISAPSIKRFAVS